MQLRDYGRVLAKRWWLLLLLALIGAATGYGISKLQIPMYRSTARLYVLPYRPDYGNILAIQNLIRAIGQRATGDKTLDRINQQLKLDLPPGSLKGLVNVVGTGDNLALDVQVDFPNPKTAQRIAQALSDLIIADNKDVMNNLAPADRIDIDIADSPKYGALERPKTSVNTSAGAALGLVIGLLLAFVLDYLDDTFKAVETVERFLALPMLGTIPRILNRAATGSGRRLFGSGGSMPQVLAGAGRLINHRNPRSPIAEAYRQLRTNIQFSSLDKPLKTLVFTSSVPQEGKSTTLANLAITMAQNESKVIVVDCDLRRPTQHTLFGVKNVRGLTNAIVGPLPEDLGLLETEIPNLLVLPTGPLPPNPSEVLGSKRMGEIIARLTCQADYVLFDTPPVVAVTDAAVLSTKVDGTVLVVMANKTKRDLAQRAKAQLEKVGANIVGVVLNNVKYDTSLHDYYAGSTPSE